MAWLQDAADRPAEVFVADVGRRRFGGCIDSRTRTTRSSRQLKVNPAEDFWFKGANGDSVQGCSASSRPTSKPGKKFPVVLLIHGGPQGEWLDQWHGRWNYQMFAAPGFGVVIINPRGSFGYGQKFVDDDLEGLGRQGVHRSDARSRRRARARIRGSTARAWAPRADRSAATW